MVEAELKCKVFDKRRKCQQISTMRIAHFSDPHINLKYHPQHLPRLRRVLEDALGRMNADHIVITGDLTSNADTRDLRTIRRLFESLGIMKSTKLTIIVGNHDIYGGPHLADEVMSFPERCRTCDYDEKLSIFQDTFAELFSDTITMNPSGYPFLKRLRKNDRASVCLMGFNSVARHSLIKNPVGSNGHIPKEAQAEALELAGHHAWKTAPARIVLVHHHLFRNRDIAHLEIADGISSRGLASRIEQRTLKLHGKRHIFKLFEKIGVDIILHGHVHFTGEYARHGINCLNGGGAVYPTFRAAGYFYNLIELDGQSGKVESQLVSRSVKVEKKQSMILKKETKRLRRDNMEEMAA
jgi:predicted phosphodiesterase